ncbi:MAG: carbohydrate-binding domain-containing protein [Bacteroidaceae bacterium]|nr:carbohydrate-binding domain-containing protein [Bacteroidaceae bacterium]
MRKTLFAACLLIAASAQAQVLYVNNSNGTFQAIDTKQAGDITFDQEQRLIDIELLKNGESIISSRFCTEGITNIAPASNKGTELTYSLTPTVTFDTADKDNFKEITQPIPTDELADEYGDYVENYSTSHTLTITFSETGATINKIPAGLTATINGGHIVINSTLGKIGYILKGKCSNGSLKIYSTKKFRLFAQGIDLTNPTGPAINIQSGKTVYFTIADDKTNTLCDGAVYSAPATGSDGVEEDQKGTLFSEGQIIFDGYKKGTGILNVKSLGGHAICSDDYIIVRGGNINILQAAKDGFRTKDKFIIGRTAAYSPVITVNATGNGIDLSEGPLTIEAGKLDIKSGGEGIKVEYEAATPDPAVVPDATIKGGYINIATTGDKSSAIKTTGNYTHTDGIVHARVSGNGSKIINSDGAVTIEGGKITGHSTGTLFADATTTDPTSSGGIKSAGNCTVTGGTIAIECSGAYAKGINCNSDVTINGGNVTVLSTGEFTDYGKRGYAISTNGLTVNGGKLVAASFDDTVSATGITLNGGTFHAITDSRETGLEGIAAQTGGWLLYKKTE